MTHRMMFKHGMVRAVLEDEKLQTRRSGAETVQPGDVLLVLETWRADDFAPEDPARTIYRADFSPDFLRSTEGTRKDRVVRWRPSMFLPKDRVRIQLTVEATRRERLQDLTEADAEAEGAMHWAWEKSGLRWQGGARLAFQTLWDSIHGKGSFAAWEKPVTVITFKKTLVKFTD